MHKWRSGTLHSGSQSGPPVKNQKQAIAIMLSEKRKAEEGNSEYAPDSGAQKVASHFRRKKRR